MELLFGDYALTVIFAIILSLIVILAARSWWTHKSVGRIPPWAPRSLFQNIRMAQNQKGMLKLQYPLSIIEGVSENSFGRTTYGSTFRFALPKPRRIFFTSDFELARLILQGNSLTNVKESEKTDFQRNLNFIDRNTYSVLTHLTPNPDRESARKALATCFSTTNLQLSWPFVEEALQKEFKSIRSLIQSGKTFNCRERVLRFFMGLLASAAFGIEFTTDGTENESNINGLEYLEAEDVAVSSRMRENSIPFLRYFFWNKDVQNGQKACETLKRISTKILKIHHEKVAANSEKVVGEATTTTSNITSAKSIFQSVQRHSLIDHISKHAYPTELARLSDLNIINFAGHDTTAFAFCFLLWELVKNPAVKAKLMAEIATVMPAVPLGCKSSTGLQHGDQKLLSAICGLEYLNWCIKESLRLWPVVGMGATRDLTEDITFKGMLLPKGSTVNCHFYTMFRERWIDRPHEYLPERWSTENPQLPLLKEMFMPFSVGRRACLGQNMAMFQLRIVVAYMLHNFDFSLAAEPTFEFFLTFKPVEMFMHVKVRTALDANSTTTTATVSYV